MKTINVKQLDEKDEEIAYALISLGIGRNVAKSLGYLQHANEATAVEIEKGMGMHQPEVSVAMKQLKERGWVKEREEKKPGKGRPYKIYRLKVGFDEIISQLERQHKSVVKETRTEIERLKGL